MDGLWGDVRLLQVPLQKHALLGSEVLHDVNTKEHDAHHFITTTSGHLEFNIHLFSFVYIERLIVVVVLPPDHKLIHLSVCLITVTDYCGVGSKLGYVVEAGSGTAVMGYFFMLFLL